MVKFIVKLVFHLVTSWITLWLYGSQIRFLDHKHNVLGDEMGSFELLSSCKRRSENVPGELILSRQFGVLNKCTNGFLTEVSQLPEGAFSKSICRFHIETAKQYAFASTFALSSSRMTDTEPSYSVLRTRADPIAVTSHQLHRPTGRAKKLVR